MAFSSAFSNAVSGLQTNGRIAEMLSNNLANAMTEGYNRAEIGVSARVLDGAGNGVRVSSITRAEDTVITQSRRFMAAAQGANFERSIVQERFAAALGEPGTNGALPTRLSSFEAAVVASRNSPESEVRLRDLAVRGQDVAAKLNGISNEARRVREDADQSIALTVQKLNSKLEQVDQMNSEFAKRWRSGGDLTGLEHERQMVIDDISEIMPIRTIKRDHGKVALFTPNGGVLLDHFRTDFEFSSTPNITHDMTVATGALGKLSVNGTEVDFGTGNGAFDGGALEAFFQIRDVDAPAFNRSIDALAAEIATRLQDPTVDPTITAGSPGLFTDGGLAYAAANEIGVAGRLSWNSTVDPTSTEIWRLRDGLYATAQGYGSDNTLLSAVENAVTRLGAPSANMGVTSSEGLVGFSNALAANQSVAWSAAMSAETYSASQLSTLREEESARLGVDTDEQLQQLLLLEKTYAANAKVITALDEMLDALLRMT